MDAMLKLPAILRSRS